MPSEHPYRKARLVNGDKPLSVTWYVIFYVWDALQGKLVKKRDYTVNRFATKKERHNHALRLIREINEALKQGYHINAKVHKKQAVVPINLKNDFTVEQAFKFILQFVKINKRKTTYDVYASSSKLFLEFCALNHWQKYKIDKLERLDILSYLDYAQTTRELSNVSRNNYLGSLKTMFGYMIERGMITVNPAVGIRDEKTDIGRNIAFRPVEIKTVKEAITTTNPRLWLYCTFLYYGFIRPAEIARIRVNMIDLDENVIVLPGEITKNHKTRHVRVSPPFKRYIEALTLDTYRPNDYVFGYNLNTGPVALQKNYASSRHTKITTALGFNSDYTPYSWKHTGVVDHYKAGVDIKSIQMQCGHSTLHETDVYLKSLGLTTNKEIEDKSPTI